MKALFTITGKVQPGHKRGKGLGFPTLNLQVNEKLPEGIFISQTIVAGKQLNSLTFVGAAKTYNETIVQAETYLFDFSQDIYGQEVTVTALKKIRDNQKFDSEEALIKRMEEDKQEALEFFTK